MTARAVFVSMIALSLVACGSDEEETDNNNNDNSTFVPTVSCNGDFDTMAACGGDITGTWTLGEICGDDIPAEAAGLAEECPDAVISNLAYDVDGTLTVDETNFTEALTGTVSANVVIPTECLVVQGQQVNCAVIQALVNSEDGITSACTEQTDGSCDCAITADLSYDTAGTYTVENGVATVTTSEGMVEYDYCVEGNQLTVRESVTSEALGRPIFAFGKP